MRALPPQVQRIARYGKQNVSASTEIVTLQTLEGHQTLEEILPQQLRRLQEFQLLIHWILENV